MTELTGYIIHTRPHNERTQFAVVFTESYGVVGIATPTKRLLSQFCQYQLSEQRGKLKLLSPVTLAPTLTGSNLYCAMYLNELIYRFCKPRDAHPKLYRDYHICLSKIQDPQIREASLRYFELCILEASGYGIDISHIQSPYVKFDKYNGLTESFSPCSQSTSTHALSQMLERMQPSPEIKRFFRHIIQSVLPSNIQSGLFYEKI